MHETAWEVFVRGDADGEPFAGQQKRLHIEGNNHFPGLA
jgi:hypothetical protein